MMLRGVSTPIQVLATYLEVVGMMTDDVPDMKIMTVIQMDGYADEGSSFVVGRGSFTVNSLTFYSLDCAGKSEPHSERTKDFENFGRYIWA